MKPLQCALLREIFLLISLTVSFCCGQAHYFLRQPAIETVVRLGDVATLQCAVANMRTSVQWVVDGFSVEPLRDGRYRYVGNESKGEYNLQINNTQLIDDGVYDCQVSMPKYGKPLISRFANLTVLVPPRQIQLTPVTRGLINAQYPGTVAVTCDVPDTKPPAQIQWRIDGLIFSNASYTRISAGSEPKLLSTVSSIVLSTAKHHDGSLIECIVDHLALDEPVMRRAVLNVLQPPSQSTISGLRPGPTRSGDNLSTQCTPNGENPAPSISWSIGENVIEDEYRISKIENAQTSQIVVIGSVALVVLGIIVISSVLVHRRCRMPKQTNRPRTIETDCESPHTESNPSSRCSSAKNPEGNKSGEDSELMEMQGVECRNQLLENEDERHSCGSSAFVNGGRVHCFEGTNCRLGDQVALLNRGCCTLGRCTCSGLPESDVSASISPLDFRNKYPKYATTTTKEVYTRMESVPGYRVAVALSDEFHTNSNRRLKSCSTGLQPSQPLRSDHDSEYTTMNNLRLKSSTPAGDYQVVSQNHFANPQFDASRYYHPLKPLMVNGNTRPNGSHTARMNLDHLHNAAARQDDGYTTIPLPVGRNSPGNISDDSYAELV